MSGAGKPLVYLCYGDESTYRQTVFSILSVRLKERFPTPIAVYCDRPDQLMGLDVETIAIGARDLAGWLGGSDYIHRRKTCTILDALDRFEAIAFLDADTYLTRAPDRLLARIGPGRACLHLREGFVEGTGTPFDRALRAQLAAHTYHDRSGAPIAFGKRPVMWNTGVVGVHRADRGRVEDALHLSDQIWRDADPQGAFGKKIHHAEQFAMGWALRDLRLRETADCVYHYWPAAQKREFAERIAPRMPPLGRRPTREGMVALYRARVRERGPRAAIEEGKMAVRRLALNVGALVPGVRRSVL